MSKQYEDGTKFSEWYYQKESYDGQQIYSVRRTVNEPNNKKQKLERYPIAQYKIFRHIEKQVKDFVIRLNGRDPRIERIKEKLKFNHAYIDDELLEVYEKVFLRGYIPDPDDARQLTIYLKKYALNFFIGKLGHGNPLDWKRDEHKWALALLSKTEVKEHILFEDGELRSANVLKRIVFELNRFMRFIHTQKPDIPALTFDPLKPAILKEHEARRKMADQINTAKYIPVEDWTLIEKNLPAGWGDVIRLCYYYGLRRNEAYGLSLQDVRKQHISVEKQFNKIIKKERSFKPLKGRYQRKTPHWHLPASRTYACIQNISNLKIHPDSITDAFAKLCSQLKLPRYTVHDLRRSFITNCIKKEIAQEDLRLAVGHVDGATTYKYYVMDTRDLDNDAYIPDDTAQSA